MNGNPCPRSTANTSAIFPSSPTSTTARARWPIACWKRPAPWTSATCASRRSTTWTWSASAASRSKPGPSPCATSTRARDYELNLIDTPGHVDFQYEVSRSLACCEGAVLLVDAFQGVEAQTVANAYAAMEHNLAIVPVLNKVDLEARPARRGDRRNGIGAGDQSRRRAAVQRQDGRRHRSLARGHRRARAAADGRSRGAAASDGVRLATTTNFAARSPTCA